VRTAIWQRLRIPRRVPQQSRESIADPPALVTFGPTLLWLQSVDQGSISSRCAHNKQRLAQKSAAFFMPAKHGRDTRQPIAKTPSSI
jgi:hypothetical protein